MINEILNKKDNEINKRLFFDTLKLKKITCLCGANGSGKTSLLKCFINNKINVTNKTKHTKHMVYSYSNSLNNYKELKNKSSGFSYDDQYNPYCIVKMLNSELISEGQKMIYSINDFFFAIENLPIEDNLHYIFTIDEFDSGLSINNIKIILDKIVEFNKRDDFQFIISFNHYYVAKYFNNDNNIINMYTGKFINFNNYNEYVDFICNENYLRNIEEKTQIKIGYDK